MSGLFQIPLFDDEVLSSYVARLARANGHNLTFRFCSELGLDFRKTAAGHDVNIERLAYLTKQPVEKLHHHAVPYGEHHEAVILGERFEKRSHSSYQIRFCHACLAEDETCAERMPGTRRYQRATWLLKSFSSCVHHSCTLVELEPHTRNHHIDFFQRLDARSEEISRKTKEVLHRIPSPIETFIHDRMLGQRRHGSLLDRIPVSIAVDFARLLGIAVLYGKNQTPSKLSDEQRSSASLVGFSYLRGGDDGMIAALDIILDENRTSRGGVHTTYGNLFKTVNNQESSREYHVILKLIIEHAERNINLRHNSRVAAEAMTPQWTSVSRIARETGLTRGLVKRRLIDAGILERANKPIAIAVRRMFSEGDRCIFGKAAAEILGCHAKQFYRLVTSGLINRFDVIPTEPSRVIRPKEQTRMFLLKDIQNFKKAVYDEAKSPLRPGLVSLKKICRLHSVPQADVFSRIIDGQLKTVALSGSSDLLDNLMLDPAEFKSSALEQTHLTAAQACIVLDIRRGSMAKLVRANIIPAIELRPKAQRFATKFILKADLEIFEKRYCTIGRLVDSTGLDRNTIRGRMRTRKIKPAFSPVEYGVCLLRSEDVARVLAD